MKKFFKWVGISIAATFGIIFTFTIIMGIFAIFEDSPELTQEQKDSIAVVQLEAKKLEKEAERLKQIEQLKREIASINKGIDFSTYRGSLDALQLEFVLFKSWSDIIQDGLNSEDQEMINLAKSLKNKVSAVQVKELPVLRKFYVKLLDQKLWENDIDVSSNGGKYTTINITGGIFAANKNIKEMQNTLNETFHLYRFKQSQYRWYKESDEYQYYDIPSKKDNELF